MSPLRFGIAMHESAEEQRQLDELASRLGGGLGPDGAGPVIAQELSDIAHERFASGGFGTWPPLAPATIRRRRFGVGYYRRSEAPGATPEGPVLVWSGRLRASLADPFGSGASDAVLVMQPRLLEKGTRVRYANLHVPDRNPLELRAEDERRLEEAYREYLDQRTVEE